MKNLRVRHFDGFVVLVILFLFTAALMSHAQIAGSSVQPVNGPSYSVPDHPAHASQSDLRPETSLLGSNGMTTAHGERPLSDFYTYTYVKPLGDVAREYRAEHAKLSADDRAQIHWNQQ